MKHHKKRVDVLVNPKSGHAVPLDHVRDVLERRFPSSDWKCKIHELDNGSDVTELARKACKKGASLVVAAGGDGTVGKVANGLVKSDVPLGILPLGTGNDLARALHVPLDLEGAADLLAGKQTVTEIDAMKVGQQYFFSNVSAGVSAQMMDGTSSREKKRFGPLAYIWTLLNHSSSLRLRSYSLTIDGQRHLLRASEVLISNATLLDNPGHVFGPVPTLRDGKLEIYAVSADNTREYVGLLWDLFRSASYNAAQLHHWEAEKRCELDVCDGKQLVQADGRIIGQTPVEIRIVPKALSVIMPIVPEETNPPQPGSSMLHRHQEIARVN
jgi:YegS/Rv2252/BmrU family lipid kinase